MKRRGLALVTVLTILFTGFVLARAGWFAAAYTLRSLPHRVDARHLKSYDPFTGAAAARWRRCQPAHWRACMMQP